MLRFLPICLAAALILHPVEAAGAGPGPAPAQEGKPPEQDGALSTGRGAGASGGETGDKEKEALVEEFLARANELIADRNYDVASTDRYVVKTDDPRVLVGEVMRLLESFRTFFDDFWSPRMELRPCEERASILLFYSRYKYRQLLPDAERSDEGFAPGHYRPFFSVVALHTDTVGPADLPDLLIHEAAHQLVQQRIYGRKRVPSLWVSEGLATYFGRTLRRSSGEFLAGRIGGKGVSLLKEAGPGRARLARDELEAFRKELKEAPEGFLDEIIYMGDPDRFYGPEAAIRYRASWLLVHFLLHTDEGARAPAFTDYLRREARGEGGPDRFYEAIGIGPLDLESALRAYVGKLKAR